VYRSYGRGTPEIKKAIITAKFKREVIRCAEEKGNCKAAAISGVNESNVRLWLKHNAVIGGVRRHEGNSVDPRKDDFLKLMMHSSSFFFKRDARLDCL
jgi:hypothetical protein